MRQINPDVVCAYPITPQTEVVQIYAQMVADGKVDSEFVTVESEHSAMSAVIGSAAAGARTMTATSSQGFALMWELLFIAASYRLPIVMTTVNRALSGPINIHCDHSDTMGGRDTGWIQIYGEDHQQAYDNCIQAIRIAEHMDVRLPAMHMYDGYVISGAIGPLVMLPDEKVRDFIGPYKAINPLARRRPTRSPWARSTVCTAGTSSTRSRRTGRWTGRCKVIQDVADEYAELSGRQYGLLDPYRLDDAEIAIVVVGSTAGTTRMIVDKLRAKGVEGRHGAGAGFRPFPAVGLSPKRCEHVKVVGVMDRADSFGAQGGPVFLEITRGALRQRPAAAGPAVHLRPGRTRHLPRQHRAGVRRAREAAQSKKRASTERRYLNLRED